MVAGAHGVAAADDAVAHGLRALHARRPGGLAVGRSARADRRRRRRAPSVADRAASWRSGRWQAGRSGAAIAALAPARCTPRSVTPADATGAIGRGRAAASAAPPRAAPRHRCCRMRRRRRRRRRAPRRPRRKPVPTAAPAPSCGPPETRPLAMPGPKMPRPSSDSAASTSAMASSMVGWLPPKPAVNSENSVEPMPTMTASTSTLMPDEIDVAEHALGHEGGLAEQAEGDQHEAGERRQLELDQGDEELDRQDEEGEQHHDQANSRHGDLDEVLEEADVAHQAGDRVQDRPAGIEPGLRDRPGRRRSAWTEPVPEAFRPSPAKLSKTMRARLFQLPMR